MKAISLLAGLLGLAIPMAAHAAATTGAMDSQVVARVHHGALQQFAASGGGKAFLDIWNLPATAQFRDQTLDKLAAAAATRFQAKAGGNGGSCGMLLRPLLGALATNELYAEVFEARGGALEGVFAVRLDEGHAQIWQANVARLLSGWELRQGHLSSISTNAWHVLAWNSGTASSERAHALLAELQRGTVPLATQGNWLTLEAKLARCAPWFNLKAAKTLPDLALGLSAKKELLRTEARFTFAEPLAAKHERWEIPLNTIRDPLISFTACQGFGNWLSKQPFFQDLGMRSVPNQLFLWGLSYTMFQLQAAVPVTDASGELERIEHKWMPKSNDILAQHAVGKMSRMTNRAELVWRGLPILVPYLEPARDSGHEFLHAGIFPINQPTNPPPVALFQQLTAQTNLVYYDWEITQFRLNQLRPLLQLSAVFLNISPMSTNSAASKWLDAVEPKLGNAVTEVTQTSPRELKLVRTSYLGFNGLELLALSNWLEGTNFPHIDPALHFRAGLTPSRPGKAKR